MSVSNRFLDQAIAGLDRGNIWITQGIGIRGKDYLPIRVLKSLAKNIASFLGTSFFGHYIYSDIRVDSVLSDLTYANWAGVDPQKAKTFFTLFERVTKRQQSVGVMPASHSISSVSQVINKRIEEDTFVQNWTQRNDRVQMLMEMPLSKVYVIVDDRDYSVVSDRFGHVYVHDAHQGRELACITLYQNNEIKVSLSGRDAPSVNANTLGNILLKAHAQLSSDDANVSRQPNLTEEQRRQWSDLMPLLVIKAKNPDNPLPFHLEDMEVDFEGFKYKLEVFLRGASVTDGTESFFVGMQQPSIEFIGKKAGRVDKRIAFFFSSRISERENNLIGQPVLVSRSMYTLKKTFFDSDIGALISAFHKQIEVQKKLFAS